MQTTFVAIGTLRVNVMTRVIFLKVNIWLNYRMKIVIIAIIFHNYQIIMN